MDEATDVTSTTIQEQMEFQEFQKEFEREKREFEELQREFERKQREFEIKQIEFKRKQREFEERNKTDLPPLLYRANIWV